MVLSGRLARGPDRSLVIERSVLADRGTYHCTIKRFNRPAADDHRSGNQLQLVVYGKCVYNLCWFIIIVLSSTIDYIIDNDRIGCVSQTERQPSTQLYR
jgi:hypothetical protein